MGLRASVCLFLEYVRLSSELSVVQVDIPVMLMDMGRGLEEVVHQE